MMYLEDLVHTNIETLAKPVYREKAKKALLTKARTEIRESHWFLFTKVSVGPYVNKAAHKLARLLKHAEWETRYAALEVLGAMRPETLLIDELNADGTVKAEPLATRITKLAEEDESVSDPARQLPHMLMAVD